MIHSPTTTRYLRNVPKVFVRRIDPAGQQSWTNNPLAVANRAVDKLRLGDCFEVLDDQNKSVRVEFVSLARYGLHYRITVNDTLFIIRTRLAGKPLDAENVLAAWLDKHVPKARLLKVRMQTAALTLSPTARHFTTFTML